MHWTEIVGVLLIAVLMMLGLVLLSVFLLIGVGLAAAWFNPHKTSDTPFGKFTKTGPIWEGFVPDEGITVSVDDADDLPDPSSLDRLSRVLSELRELERLARTHVGDLTDSHRLDHADVTAPGQSSDLELSFVADDRIEMVHVRFNDGAIVDWGQDSVH